MENGKRIPSAIYKLLIVVATVIWGASFVFMKDAVGVMEPAWLIGVRFTLTALLLTVLFWRHVRRALTKRDLALGAVLGLANFLAYWVQTIGLAYTSPGKNAFLTAVYCVIVPFIYWLVAARRPTRYNLLAAVLGVVGIGCVSLGDESLAMGFGDVISLASALFFAIHIVLVGRFSHGRNVLALTVFQFWMGGLCGLVVGALTEPAPTWAAITPDFLWNMAYLVLLASCVALVFQNVALAHVPPNQASLLLSLESVFGVVFSVLLYGEQLTFKLVVGFALIFGAIIVSEVFPRKPKGAAPLARDAAAREAIEGSDGSPAADLLSEDAMAAGLMEAQMQRDAADGAQAEEGR